MVKTILQGGPVQWGWIISMIHYPADQNIYFAALLFAKNEDKVA